MIIHLPTINNERSIVKPTTNFISHYFCDSKARFLNYYFSAVRCVISRVLLSANELRHL